MKLQIGMDSMLKLLQEFINQTGFAVQKEPSWLQKEPPQLQKEPPQLQKEPPRLQKEHSWLKKELSWLQKEPPRFQKESLHGSIVSLCALLSSTATGFLLLRGSGSFFHF
jgi:hypothetical protein